MCPSPVDVVKHLDEGGPLSARPRPNWEGIGPNWGDFDRTWRGPRSGICMVLVQERLLTNRASSFATILGVGLSAGQAGQMVYLRRPGAEPCRIRVLLTARVTLVCYVAKYMFQKFRSTAPGGAKFGRARARLVELRPLSVDFDPKLVDAGNFGKDRSNSIPSPVDATSAECGRFPARFGRFQPIIGRNGSKLS